MQWASSIAMNARLPAAASAAALTPFADDPLRRHIEQAAALLADAGQHLVPLVRQQRAVQVGRRDAVHAQAVDLILHQRDQRRTPRQRRHLVPRARGLEAK
jgi:hypothetical protein